MVNFNTELVNKTDKFIFATFWKRVLAALIDGAISIIFMPISLWLLNWELNNGNILPGTVWAIANIVVFMWIVKRFGGTPGKLLIGLRIVDAGGKFLNWERVTRRIIFPSLILFILARLQIWKTINTFSGNITELPLLEISRVISDYGEPFSSLVLYFAYAIYLDVGAILFNKQKRAIHDFIAGSYVITEDSYKKLTESVSDGNGQSSTEDDS